MCSAQLLVLWWSASDRVRQGHGLSSRCHSVASRGGARRGRGWRAVGAAAAVGDGQRSNGGWGFYSTSMARVGALQSSSSSVSAGLTHGARCRAWTLKWSWGHGRRLLERRGTACALGLGQGAGTRLRSGLGRAWHGQPRGADGRAREGRGVSGCVA